MSKLSCDNSKRDFIYTSAAVAAIFVLSALAVTVGRYHVTLAQLAALMLPAYFPDVETSSAMSDVVFNIRMPRIMLAIVAGAGLAAAGGAFQALFSNPLATPDTLGVATGASFGAVLAILLGLPSLAVQLFALVSGLVAVSIVYFVSRVRGSSSIIMIILAGMVVSALFSALVSIVKFAADPQDVLPAITFWLMGSLSAATKETLALGSPLIIIGVVVIYLLRWKLNAMTLSEEEATALGIPVKRIRLIVILAAAMITASAVSMCGLIGWVGLLIPHISRMIFGNDNRYVIPSSIVLGSIFMLVIDTAARCTLPSEVPASILTAVIGAPFFIFLLRKSGGVKI